MNKQEIYVRRPFKTRNADEFDLEEILNLYISPSYDLSTWYDYENIIVKGRMGTGKTMYLRANYAYYLYGIVPALLKNESNLILPVFISLNNFQHITEPSEIYKAVIIQIIEEMTSLYIHLSDSSRLRNLHRGIQSISENILDRDKLSRSIKQLAKLGADEYVERISTELGLSGGISQSFFRASADWREKKHIELVKKPSPGIGDIKECYDNLLSENSGKLLILIDEAGSLDNKFFKSDDGSSPFFAILMNQLRTLSFVRTKIAIYPNSYSDMLTETRYGDVLKLEYNIKEPEEYDKFRDKVQLLIENYINNINGELIYKVSDFFRIGKGKYNDDAIEQIIFASNGNLRRLMNLLDLSMNVAYENHPKSFVVNKDDALKAIIQHAKKNESLYNYDDRKYLEKLADACRTRSTYNFKFPSMSPILYKYTNKSEEFNVLNLEQLGSGRKSNIYSFDYAYCVYMNIPTHYIDDSTSVNRERSLNNGYWIPKITQLNDDIMVQAELPGKIQGEIEYLNGKSGFICGEDDVQYYYSDDFVIDSDKSKVVHMGKKVKFYPTKYRDTDWAVNIEIL